MILATTDICAWHEVGRKYLRETSLRIGLFAVRTGSTQQVSSM